MCVCSLSAVNVSLINRWQERLEAVAGWSVSSAAQTLLASDEWTKEHGTGLSFHVGILVWKAVGLISEALERWLMSVPTSEPIDEAGFEDFYTTVNAIKEDAEKLSKIEWRSIPCVLPEQELKKCEPVMRALVLMSSSTQDSFLCF